MTDEMCNQCGSFDLKKNGETIYCASCRKIKRMTDENLKPLPDRDILGGVHSEITLWYDRSGSINLHKSFGIEYPVRYTRAQEPTGDAVEALRHEIKTLRGVAALIDHRNPNGNLKDISDSMRMSAFKLEKKVLAALQTPAAGNAIPAGYALVPIEPDHDQSMAGFSAACEYGLYEIIGFRASEKIYKAMIAAAPSTNKEETK